MAGRWPSTPDEVLPRDRAALHDGLNDGIGQRLHSPVARMPRHTLVREGPFRTGGVDRLAPERAGIYE